MAMPQRFGQQPRALDSEPLGYAKITADLGERMHAVHLPTGRGANPGAVSRTGACPRQMVHGRHPLPCADAEGRGDGGKRRPHDGLAAPPQFANEHTKEVNRAQARRTRIQFTSVEKRLEDMDRMGIDIQAITPSPAQTFYSVPADLGIATARVINDNLADICGKHPDRFVGLGTVPFQAPELAVAELERLHKSLGLRGIEIATNVAGADLSEPRFRPIFARAEELGPVPVMHPTGFPEASRFRDHYFTNIIGNPLDTTVAVHHLIFRG